MLPAAQEHAFAQADQAGSRADRLGCGGAAVVLDPHRQSASVAGDADVDGRPVRVPHGVGQPLLDGAVGAQGNARGTLAGTSRVASTSTPARRTLPRVHPAGSGRGRAGDRVRRRSAGRPAAGAARSAPRVLSARCSRARQPAPGRPVRRPAAPYLPAPPSGSPSEPRCRAAPGRSRRVRGLTASLVRVSRSASASRSRVVSSSACAVRRCTMRPTAIAKPMKAQSMRTSARSKFDGAQVTALCSATTERDQPRPRLSRPRRPARRRRHPGEPGPEGSGHAMLGPRRGRNAGQRPPRRPGRMSWRTRQAPAGPPLPCTRMTSGRAARPRRASRGPRDTTGPRRARTRSAWDERRAMPVTPPRYSRASTARGDSTQGRDLGGPRRDPRRTRRRPGRARWRHGSQREGRQS